MIIEKKKCRNDLMEVVHKLHRTNHEAALGQIQVSNKQHGPILVNSAICYVFIKLSKGMIFNDVSL